jgi:hypothetical protein
MNRQLLFNANDASVAVPIPVEIESTKQIESILRDRVTILANHIGLKLSDETTLQESLCVLDWTLSMNDHVQFMIGDVLNFGNAKWGDEKYAQVLNQTGRARSTLGNYARVAKKIPAEKRIEALSFSHYKEIAALHVEQQIDEVLKEVGKQAEKENAPSVKALREKVRKLAPPNVKTPKHGKSKKKDVLERVSYEPDAEEQAKLDTAEEKAKELADLISAGADETGRPGDVFKVVAQCDSKEKRRWLDFLHPIIQFYKMLDRVTGY